MTAIKGFGYLLICLLSCAGWAQDSPQYRACSQQAYTQAQMNACAGDEAKRVDAELNKTYKLLLSTVKDNPLATAKIKSSQRAWIAYRDAYIEAMYPAKDKAAEYGSMYPMEFSLLYAKITGRQVVALRDLLSRYQKQTSDGAR